MNILILTGREQAGCDQIMEVAPENDIAILKGIAEEAEGVTLDWLTYPPLPGSEFAISPLYPKKVYNILPWSLTSALPCPPALYQYLESINPGVLALRMEAPSGTVEKNYGTAGSALDAEISGAIFGGTIGTLPALEFDGANGFLKVPNHAAIAGLTTQRWMFQIAPDTLGEGDSGMLFCWGNDGASTDPFFRFGSGGTMRLRLYNSINQALTFDYAAGSISDLIGASGIIFMDYDDANALGNGRKPRVWKGVDGALTQLTQSGGDVAVTGTYEVPTAFLGLFSNATTQANVQDGKCGYTYLSGGLWTLPEMYTIMELSGL